MKIKNKKFINFIPLIVLSILVHPLLSIYRLFILNDLSNRTYYSKENLVVDNDESTFIRAFGSIIPFKDGFRFYYTKMMRDKRIFSINLREARKINELKDAKSLKILKNDSEKNIIEFSKPYVFQDQGIFRMIITTNTLDPNKNKYIEEIKMATSPDGINWDLVNKPLLSPKFDWENDGVSNWGIIKIDDTYYMSYSTNTYSRKSKESSLGIAFSKDLKNWERLSENPILTDKKCCSSFFRYKNFIYKIVSANNKFEVYKFENFENFNKDSLIGYWYPLFSRVNLFTVGHPDVLTQDISKIVSKDQPFLLTYSIYNKGWLTKYSKYISVDSFIENIYYLE